MVDCRVRVGLWLGAQRDTSVKGHTGACLRQPLRAQAALTKATARASPAKAPGQVKSVLLSLSCTWLFKSTRIKSNGPLASALKWPVVPTVQDMGHAAPRGRPPQPLRVHPVRTPLITSRLGRLPENRLPPSLRPFVCPELSGQPPLPVTEHINIGKLPASPPSCKLPALLQPRHPANSEWLVLLAWDSCCQGLPLWTQLVAPLGSPIRVESPLLCLRCPSPSCQPGPPVRSGGGGGSSSLGVGRRKGLLRGRGKPCHSLPGGPSNWPHPEWAGSGTPFFLAGLECGKQIPGPLGWQVGWG